MTTFLFPFIHNFRSNTDLFKILHENLNNDMLKQLEDTNRIFYEDELKNKLSTDIINKIDTIKNTFLNIMYSDLLNDENTEDVISKIIIKQNKILLVLTFIVK